MTRVLSLAAALVAATSLPALAVDSATTSGLAMQNIFTSSQAREHLMRTGYANVSALEKDENGRWIGTATKDGKTRAVAVEIKGKLVN
jgi:hypothetical protein